jgi:hypothetical protein
MTGGGSVISTRVIRTGGALADDSAITGADDTAMGWVRSILPAERRSQHGGDQFAYGF